MMCLLRSEESLSCAENTSFCPQKTTDILNNPQRHKGHTKKGTMHTLISFKKKKIQNLPPVIDRSRKKVAPLSSLRSKRFRTVSEQRTRNESQRPHEKWSELKSGEGLVNKKVDLWGLEGVRAQPLLPLLPTGLWLTAVKDENVSWLLNFRLSNE